MHAATRTAQGDAHNQFNGDLGGRQKDLSGEFSPPRLNLELWPTGATVSIKGVTNR